VTFNEALSQTVAMLQQHGRVSYRSLKRQFALDDDFLMITERVDYQVFCRLSLLSGAAIICTMKGHDRL